MRIFVYFVVQPESPLSLETEEVMLPAPSYLEESTTDVVITQDITIQGRLQAIMILVVMKQNKAGRS